MLLAASCFEILTLDKLIKFHLNSGVDFSFRNYGCAAKVKKYDDRKAEGIKQKINEVDTFWSFRELMLFWKPF